MISADLVILEYRFLLNPTTGFITCTTGFSANPVRIGLGFSVLNPRLNPVVGFSTGVQQNGGTGFSTFCAAGAKKIKVFRV